MARKLTNKDYERTLFSLDKWILVTGSCLSSKHIIELPAVYVIYINEELAYIGQSNTPRFRMSQHGISFYEKYETPWGIFEDVYMKIKYPSKYGKEAMIEKRLIKKLKPKFNKYTYKQKKYSSL